MKVVIFGLGNFGMSLALHLADTGNEVVVVDKNRDKINLIKDRVSHAVTLDATNEASYKALPLNGTDRAIIGIGDEEGTAVMVTAIVKKMCKTTIIARSSSKIQDTIYKAMGIDQIIHPEGEYAEKLTKKLNLRGSIENFELDSNYLVSEVAAHPSMVGKNVQDIKLEKKYNLALISIIREEGFESLIRLSAKKQKVIGFLKPNTVIKEGDILIVFGKSNSIENYLKKDHKNENN